MADELVAMMADDQYLLQRLFEAGELPSASYHPRMKALHERNAARLKAIIGRHGWPGRSLVGEEAAKAAWLIAQHAVSDLPFMTECIGHLEAAVARGEAPGWQLAFLQDRVRTLSSEPQVYGTQFDVDDGGWPTPFPVEAPETVNARRAALGMNFLEERLAQMIERERRRRAPRDQAPQASSDPDEKR
ncbi:DUF6624 domain-containing protein [Halomonas sp. 1390]|uniref:DUF6624 domain-containing protein n=1 Tax=Halomonas sp. B23F22_3 TaxID=3459516 RepID=UPI00373DF2CC